MSYLPYQFIVCTPEQWVEVNALIPDLGGARLGPDGRLLTDKNGNLPLSEDEMTAAVRLGVEIVPSSMIEAWLQDNGWNIDSRGGA
ncbi:MAG: hypothetical protein A2Y38_18985 [Spirochaetes bacterium GWB1_59_5]|nr:MAG: hypothetical protein A2Y38_18985 [Spirochaetes bacterium GWB1_59_5]